MFCPNCGNKLNGNEEFCSSCGTKVKENINIKEQNSSNNYHQNSSDSIKINKSVRDVIIIIVILLIIIIGICLFFMFSKKDEKPITNDIEQNITEKEPEQNIDENEEVIYSTFQKLKEDFDNKVIDVNKYFTELVYYQYDSTKLDEKYKSNELYYTTSCQSELIDLLDKYKDELNQDIIRRYVEYVTLNNISLGSSNNVEVQSNASKDYEVKLLEDVKEDEGNVANHRLDKVALSTNGNFLIWYTDTGSDAITENQLQEISNGLESSSYRFEKEFGIDYSYFPYQDSVLNNDYKNAKEVLIKNGISTNKLNSAMSVYIYDTGSKNVLAYYMQPYKVNVLVDFIVQLGLKDNDGVVTFPYIVINKQGISSKNESLKQLYAHELFHHFQYLFCRSTSGERCVNIDYAEGIANFASAVATDVNTTNNFLNKWASVYTKNVSSSLAKIADGANYGYGTFPYFYAYSKVVSDWPNILMKAHNEIKPFEYLKNNTSKEDLIKISEKLTYNLLTNSFDNKALYSNKSISIKEVINSGKNINETIEPGAILYYEISGNNNIEVISGNKDYVGIKVYGLKDDTYTELVSSMDKVEVDLTYYVKYDKFYVAVYNADIVNSYSYTIDVRSSTFAENTDFVTTFNNYNIEIVMDITVAGINTYNVLTGVVDELHQKEYLDISTTSMGLITLNNKVYHDFNSGYTYMTQPYGGDVWWKEKSASQMVDLGVILDKLINMKNVTKIAENHYKVKMTNDDVKGLIASGNVDNAVISGDVYVEVYTKDGYISKLEYDFTDMIKGFEKFTITIKCSNFNNAGNVEIPQSIIDNAKVQ